MGQFSERKHAARHMRAIGPKSDYITPYVTQLSFIDPGSETLLEIPHHCLLPHELVASLFHHDRNNQMFITKPQQASDDGPNNKKKAKT